MAHYHIPLLLQEELPSLAGTFLETPAKAVKEDLSLNEQTHALFYICCDQPQSDGEAGNLVCAPVSCYANMRSYCSCFTYHITSGTVTWEHKRYPFLPLKNISCLQVAPVSPRTWPQRMAYPIWPPLHSIRQSQTQFSFTKPRLEGLDSQLLMMPLERASR